MPRKDAKDKAVVGVGSAGGLRADTVVGGVEFDILATPGSSVSKIRGVHGSALKVALRSPPEKGKANTELVELLAAALGLPVRQVSVVRGLTSRKKRVRAVGANLADVMKIAAHA